jgi:CheY-like chemotaxis protein
MRILVAEDKLINQQVAEELLGGERTAVSLVTSDSSTTQVKKRLSVYPLAHPTGGIQVIPLCQIAVNSQAFRKYRFVNLLWCHAPWCTHPLHTIMLNDDVRCMTFCSRQQLVLDVLDLAYLHLRLLQIVHGH